MSKRSPQALYTSLIVFYFSDMALYMMIIWLSYKVSKNPLLLGFILFISVIIPLLVKRFIKAVNILALDIRSLMILRIGLYVLIGFIALFKASMISFTAMALCFGLLSLSIISNYESYNNQLVFLGYITANKSARIMQTVIQIGAFFGAMIGGTLLSYFDFSKSVLLIAIIDIISCFLVIYLARNWQFLPKDNHPHPKEQSANISNDKRLFYLLCLCLSLIGIHIISFNFVTPIVFQDLLHWNAQSFGMASAFAGLGAFVAVFFRQSTRLCVMMSLLLVAVDMAFMWSSIKLLSFALCFLIGFFINAIRVSIREKLSSLASTTAQAQYIGQTSAVIYTLSQSAYSLVIGVLLLGVSPQWAKSLLPLSAFFIFLGYLSITQKIPVLSRPSSEK